MTERELLNIINQPEVLGENIDKKFARKQKHRERLSEVANLTWQEVIEKIISETSDPIFGERKRELLERFADPRQMIKELQELKMWSTKVDSLRGAVFELLVINECNQQEDDSLLAKLILNCLRNPKILNLSRSAFKNPDYLGVLVDNEKKIAYINGMYEVKIGLKDKPDQREKKQIREFYDNIKLISDVINKQLLELKQKYHYDFIPDGGLQVKKFEEMLKLMIFPEPENEKQAENLKKFKSYLMRKNWNLHTSVFTSQDITRLAAKLIQVFQKEKKSILKKKNI